MSGVINTDLPVDTNVAPIKITAEDKEALSEVEKLASELDAVRRELGRILQMESNLVDKANSFERSLNTKRKVLIEKYEISGGGKWVIDFNACEFVKLLDVVPTPA